MVQRKRRPRLPADGGTTTATPVNQSGTTTTTPSTTNNTSNSAKPGNSSLHSSLTLAPSQSRPARSTSYTTAGVAGVLYGDLISWALREVVLKYRHRTTVARARKMVPTFPIGHTPTPSPNHPDLRYSDKNVHADCANCSVTVSASRYAQHLEKCMGRGGRVSSRAASARLRASAERAEREDSEDAAASTTFGHRRRRSAQHDAETGQKGGTKRRRSSPAPISGSLPPSGRNR